MEVRKINTVYINVKAYELVMYCLKGILGIMMTAILILCIRAVLRISLPAEEGAAVKPNISDNRMNVENFSPANGEDILNMRMKEGLPPLDISGKVKASAKMHTADITDELGKEPVHPVSADSFIKAEVSDEKSRPGNTVDVTTDTPPLEDEEENNANPAFTIKGSLDAVYCVGSSVELDGLEFYAGDRKIPLSECEIGQTDTSTAGEKTVTVTYEGKSVEIPYKVEVYTAVLHGNGGNVGQASVPLWNYVMDESAVEKPKRLGKEFTMWYKDSECTVPFTGAVPGEVVTDIYAGWKEFKNFACDDEGYIIGYPGGPSSIQDTTLNISHHPDCVGIRSGAFSSLGKEVIEVYIPANIIDIPPDAFDTLVYLMFIYVEPSNPVYYSDGNGVIYRKDTNEMVLYPRGNPSVEFADY